MGTRPSSTLSTKVSHVRGLVGDAHINAGLKREQARFLLRGDDLLVDQGRNPSSFAHHDALETDVLSQDIVHPLLGGVSRHILDFRVSRHDAQSRRLW